MSMINRTALKSTLFSRRQCTTVASASSTHASGREDLGDSERSVSSCRTTQCERVWQGNMNEMLLTVTEAAKTLRLHPVTLRAMAAAGNCQPSRSAARGASWKLTCLPGPAQTIEARTP